ncbi:MAG TPA: hydroxymethylbilane synthase [Steroidobacteraceae bacterium]|jgi:hydroxymethylbilane synthase|nr:hydroxymethylbilane synthase [Steroidobacteraceae bacterium]
MNSRVLKLGTRRSALARAQSAAVARLLQQHHPALAVELVGIETQGDRILDKPLSTVDGKEFFTAEIDAALLSGAVDLTVHSYKDLSLERSTRLLLAAVPKREPPGDIALFAPDVRQSLAAGEEIRVGSSSPRRASFVPDFLQRMLPADPMPARVRLVELRGNVDSRLRRLHEPRGSPRHLDGIVLAFAGLARLWADSAGQQLLRELLTPLPRMLLPLSACPAAPAQGALAIECRSDDPDTARLLASIDDSATRRAVDAERALLAQRGGGCHQRFGATQIELSGLGALLYLRDADESGRPLPIPMVRWTPETPLPAPHGPLRAWDGSRADSAPAAEPIPEAVARCAERLSSTRALFVAHRRALPEELTASVDPAAHVWVPGIETWQALAERGIWVEGCGESLGFAALAPMLTQPSLQLPALDQWTVLTHAEAAGGWPATAVVATYRHASSSPVGADPAGPAPDVTHVYWHSSAQFERWRASVAPGVHHACGSGRTSEHLRHAAVQNLRVFPQVALWRQWLGL